VKVLVTGANGFLGRHVVAALLARGHGVRALVRPAARLDGLGWGNAVEIFRADVRSGTDLAPAFDGVDVLVHLAATPAGGEDGQFATAVTGTEKLLAAMARSSCKRLVLASSFSVYDWSRIRGTLDESAPLEEAPDLYERDGYTIAKSWQERVTRRIAERQGWDLTVLRPGYIWGRDHGDIAATGQKAGKIYLVIGPLARAPVTHVENCADLFAVVAEHPRARGETFNVVDNEGARVWAYLGNHLRGTGQRGVRIPIPWRLAFLLVRVAYATVFRRNPKLPHLLVPSRFEARLKPLKYSNRRAAELLGWRPPLELRECLARTYGAAAAPPLLSLGTVGP
jgi:2-alkyl-3-oxoalkanoate reductase